MGNGVILTKFSSLAAQKVVKMTTGRTVCDENFIKMMTFPLLMITHFHTFCLILAGASQYRYGNNVLLSFYRCRLVAPKFTRFNLEYIGVSCQGIINPRSTSLLSFSPGRVVRSSARQSSQELLGMPSCPRSQVKGQGQRSLDIIG